MHGGTLKSAIHHALTYGGGTTKLITLVDEMLGPQANPALKRRRILSESLAACQGHEPKYSTKKSPTLSPIVAYRIPRQDQGPA